MQNPAAVVFQADPHLEKPINSVGFDFGGRVHRHVHMYMLSSVALQLFLYIIIIFNIERARGARACVCVHVRIHTQIKSSKIKNILPLAAF